MRDFKKGIVIILILDVLLSYTVSAISLKSLLDPFSEIMFYSLPAIAIVASFLLAIILTVLFFKDGRQYKFHYYCQLGGLVVVFSIVSFTFAANKIKKDSYSQDYLTVDESPKEFQKAFSVLKSQFDTATTDFQMKSYWFANDAVPGTSDTASYSIYFTYFLHGDTSVEYYSKLIPYGSSYKAVVLNEIAESDSALKKWKHEVNDALQHVTE